MLIKQTERSLKEYVKRDELGSVPRNMVDLPSVGDLHMKIRLCFILDEIEGQFLMQKLLREIL